MNYLPQLTEDELRYICSAIPIRDAILYFRKNPEEFARIMPGFRARSIKMIDTSALLFRHCNQGFISSFIEKHIRIWLTQIQEHIDKCIKDGDSEDLAYIRTMPFSFFAGNVALYFKLTEKEYSETYITLLASAVKEIKEVIGEQEKSEITLKTKEADVEKLQLELDSSISALKSAELKFNERLNEIKALKHAIIDLEKLQTDIQNKEEIIGTLKARIRELEETIQALKTELSSVKDSRQQLEAQIKVEMEKQEVMKAAKRIEDQKPLCPKDMNEFKEYLGYNIENIGVSTGAEYYPLLKEHLSHILFQGIPIIINRCTGMALMKCVANTLTGTAKVKVLTYSNDLTTQAIDNFLMDNGRIVCLDNFIGNYNETVLLPLFERHQNKIIFMTIAYERTLYYISEEFLKYCHYLNLNRIQALSVNAELTEDPSRIDEIEVVTPKVHSGSRYSPLLRDILGQFGVRKSLAEYKCAYISDEQDLCRVLAFDVLPYCIDVLQITPYNASERFVKYAGDTGRCSYKNLFKGWFA